VGLPTIHLFESWRSLFGDATGDNQRPTPTTCLIVAGLSSTASIAWATSGREIALARDTFVPIAVRYLPVRGLFTSLGGRTMVHSVALRSISSSMTSRSAYTARNSALTTGSRIRR